MKIIQVAHSFPPRYEGIGNYCYQLSKYLAQRGHQVEVYTSRLHSSLPEYETKDGFTIHRCPYLGVIGTNRLTLILHKILRTEADIIHAHSYIFLTSNQTALAKKIKRRPFLLHLHGGMELFPSRNFSTNLFFQVKNTVYDRTVGRWTIKSADAIASVSRRDIEIAQRLFHIDESTFYWVPNAVDMDMFGRCNSDSDGLNVVFIGKLEFKKGIDVLIGVMNRVLKERSDAVFTIVGQGSLQRQVERAAKTFPKRVRVLGQVPHEKIPDVLSDATVLLLPSYSEGLPTVCLEALACGIPVVASDLGGVPEVVIDGQTGYLFPPGNMKLCAEKVLRLLDNKQTKGRMRQNCRHFVEQFYSWGKVVKKVEKIYEKIGE